MDPVSVEPLDLSLAPCEAAERLHSREGFLFLDSADHGETDQPLSILAAEPTRVITGNLHQQPERLRAVLQARQVTAMDWGFPLGGLFGHVGYEGDFVFGQYDSLLVYHHHRDRWFAIGAPPYLDALNDPASTPCEGAGGAGAAESIAFTSHTSREDFVAAVRRAQTSIADGQIYQVNLAHQFRAPRTCDHLPFALYQSLRSRSPAPYGTYFDLEGRQILSSSPECFLKMSGRGIVTRPIKGTRPRHADPLLDEKSAYDLITSPKEVAELVMITDLERNDLGQLCTFGSVQVSELLRLERFAQVFHLVSTVRGELRTDVDHLEALQRCSPGGSITGAPKKTAREIIAAIEPMPRGIYTGAIGYLGWNGESQFSIVIRTLIGEPDHWHFHVGAGIVADSRPDQEYDETLHKAAGILMACQNAPRRHRALFPSD